MFADSRGRRVVFGRNDSFDVGRKQRSLSVVGSTACKRRRPQLPGFNPLFFFDQLSLSAQLTYSFSLTLCIESVSRSYGVTPLQCQRSLRLCSAAAESRLACGSAFEVTGHCRAFGGEERARQHLAAAHHSQSQRKCTGRTGYVLCLERVYCCLLALVTHALCGLIGGQI
jgi:hypothetical protein